MLASEFTEFGPVSASQVHGPPHPGSNLILYLNFTARQSQCFPSYTEPFKAWFLKIKITMSQKMTVTENQTSKES